MNTFHSGAASVCLCGSKPARLAWALVAAAALGPFPARAAVFNHPTHSSPIALSADNRLCWSVNPAQNSVSVIRTDLNRVVATLPTAREPQSVAVDPDNQYAYVACAAGNAVSVIRIRNANPDQFDAGPDDAAGRDGQILTGAEPWNVVISPDGQRVFVANSSQDTITVLDATARRVIGQIDLRDSVCNDPDRGRHFQPRGLAVTEDSRHLYVTRFYSFTRPGGKQADDLGREGLCCRIDFDPDARNIAGYRPAAAIPLAPRVTGFRFMTLTNDTAAFPNQLQSIVLRGDQAYLPNIAASPTGPLRFNVDTHAFINVIDGIRGPVQSDSDKTINAHLGARMPEPGKKRLFFANVWAIGFTTPEGPGHAYVVSAGSDLLVKLNVDADGRLTFTEDADTTRYIDLNDPANPATRGANAGKNPQGIAVTDDGTRAYVQNFVSRNVSVVDLTLDAVMTVIPTAPLPAPGSMGEVVLVGAEMFFSSRGNFDRPPGTTVSTTERLSSDGWQNCASCHFKGLTDSVIWSFNAGPRKSVPLNGSFNPHNLAEQRILNYSAIFDEIEDFEANIRNISGPGALMGGLLDPNHGLLIGDDGDINKAPSVLNAFARPNEGRPQLTVTLPGSTVAVPALTALREWVRVAVRSPNGPLKVNQVAGGVPPGQLVAGRNHFIRAGCATCHGGGKWTVSTKDFMSPPAMTEVFTETSGVVGNFNPVGAGYLARFLRDIGSFNLGVAGQGNPFGNNIGADEKAAPTLVMGAPVAQDALGRDYNADGRGNGFNVPSLLGALGNPPYYHNGAAETLADVLNDVNHRTGGGRFPDRLANPELRRLVQAFLESIDDDTEPIDDTRD